MSHAKQASTRRKRSIKAIPTLGPPACYPLRAEHPLQQVGRQRIWQCEAAG